MRTTSETSTLSPVQSIWPSFLTPPFLIQLVTDARWHKVAGEWKGLRVRNPKTPLPVLPSPLDWWLVVDARRNQLCVFHSTAQASGGSLSPYLICLNYVPQRCTSGPLIPAQNFKQQSKKSTMSKKSTFHCFEWEKWWGWRESIG